ncbi:MAG: peptidoglycan DD-metalloendopeptidase family protein [Salibacteraceae bacterium]|nr:peptidoglycan DD-metalloendopeptidase family protein [Salibacteraceae bacterium]
MLRSLKIFLFASLLSLLGTSCGGDENLADISMPNDSIPEVKVNMAYGLNLDSFIVKEGKIKKNQMLSHILLINHIPWPEIDRLVKKSKDIYDVRKLRSGKNYTVLCKKDSTEKAEYFIYEANAIDYVVFDLRDTMHVTIEQKDVIETRREVAGVITSSLYQTLIDIDCSAGLAMEMSEIYAWSIDFYRIQKGDRFKVIFTEKWVEDTRVGIGAIEACFFEHHKENFYAFPFEQDQVIDFFDENAKSLRKAFLKSPLKFGRISSSFTMRRYHPVQKRWKAHLGTDYAAPTGTPILAVGDGKVIEARYKKFNGNYVKIKHNGTYTTQYLHMSKFASGVRSGKFVRQGDIIGYVGSTGLATGPHVCFRFWKNGKQVNHRTQKLPASIPVKKELLPQFTANMDTLKFQLDEILFEIKAAAKLAQK